MDHSMAVGAQHTNVFYRICPCVLTSGKRNEVMDFDKTFSQIAVSLFKIKIANLTSETVGRFSGRNQLWITYRDCNLRNQSLSFFKGRTVELTSWPRLILGFF